MGCSFFGGAVSIISELYSRVIHVELLLSPSDVWVRQLAAGGPEGSRTPVRKPLDITFSGCILSFLLPLERRRQTDCAPR